MPNRVTRRKFFKGLSILGLALVSLASADAGWFQLGKRNQGRINTNLWFPYGNVYAPFINIFRSADTTWRTQSGTPTEDYYNLFDANGYPTRMPSGAALYVLFIRAHLTDGVRWVMTWDGPNTGLSLSTVTAGTTLTQVDTSVNRREYTLTSAALPVNSGVIFQVSISAITEGDHLQNIKIFRKDQEALLNAGQNWSPQMLEVCAEWGRLRLMDFMWTNENPLVWWDYRSVQTDLSWYGATLRKDYYCSYGTQTNNDYVTVQGTVANPGAWVHGQPVVWRVENVPTWKTITGFTKANPAVVTAVAHGLSTGNKVEFFNMSSGDFTNRVNRDAFTITVLTPDTFSLDGINSSAWTGTFSSGNVCKQITVAAGMLSAKPLLSRDGTIFPADRLSVGDIRQCTYDSLSDRLVATVAPCSTGVSALGVGQALTCVPYELLFELASNLENVEPWVNFPAMCDEDFITNFVNLANSSLPARRSVHYEFSNEVWNPGAGFTQTFWAWRQSLLLWPSAGISISNLDFNGVNNWYGLRFYEVMTVVDTLHAASGRPYKKHFGVFTAGGRSGDHPEQRMEAPLAGLPVFPITLADSISLAPYNEPTRTGTASAEYVWKYKQGGALRQEALDYLAARFVNDGGSGFFTVDYCRDVVFPAWVTIANTYSVAEIDQYEGGWGAIPSLNSLTATTYNGEALLQTAVAITGAANNGSGAIRITGSTATLVDGQRYYISGIYGTSEANGFWEIAIISGTQFDLVGSTFTNAYVSGGQVESDRDNLFYGLYLDNRYAAVARSMLNAFTETDAKCVHPSQYCSVGGWSTGGMWGAIRDSVFGTRTPTWYMLKNWNQALN